MPGDIAWILTSTALVWLMIPGVGFFYSGMARRKSALALIWLSCASVAIVSLQWFIWGYSLAFSHTAGKFIGNLDNAFLRNVQFEPSVGGPKIPDIVYMVYQLMFAAITPALAIGATAERGRMLPACVFMFVWATLVYDPIACWTWNPNGWVYLLGGLDFAGGTPVHISSGAAALAYSVILGKRRGYGTAELNYRPQNTSYMILGTVFLWFGWFGFNGGSALAANVRAAMACTVTNLAASVGGITWVAWDYRLEKKMTAAGFCSGAIAGLVAITPGSGYVGPAAAVVFGIVGGTVCNFATQLKYLIGVDDALDIFAGHCIGGIAGNLMTGLFAQQSIAGLDGFSVINGGWLDHNYIQLAYQLADSVSGFSYSFVMTSIILLIMDRIPGLSLRQKEDGEIIGSDADQLGEFCYDFVERERDVEGYYVEPASLSHSGASINSMEKKELPNTVQAPEGHHDPSSGRAPQHEIHEEKEQARATGTATAV